MLATYQAVGLNETERRTAVSKKTILSWARAANIVPEDVTAELTRRNSAAAAAAAAQRARESEEARERMLRRVLKIREAASVRELEVLAAGGFTKEDLRDLSNSRRFANHDAELLLGYPTERTENLVDGDAFIELMHRAVAAALTAIPVLYRDAFTAALAVELRQVRDASALELEPSEIEDAELVEDEGDDVE